ncbi:MAG: ribosomal biogenesis protein, partial [Thermoplasmatota archaeon]
MSDKERLLYTSWFGVFVVEDGEVIDKVLFDKDPEVLAEKRYRMKNDKILKEEEQFLESYDLTVTSERLKELGDYKDISEEFVKPEDYSYNSELLQKTLVEVG